MSFFSQNHTEINSDDWTITKKTTRTIKHENFSKMKNLKVDRWALSLNHHWFIVPLVHIVRCRYKAGKFVQIQYKRRGRYGVSICEFRVSFTFCLSHRIGVCNIVLNWAALWRHSTVLDFDPVISVITNIMYLYVTITILAFVPDICVCQ